MYSFLNLFFYSIIQYQILFIFDSFQYANLHKFSIESKFGQLIHPLTCRCEGR